MGGWLFVVVVVSAVWNGDLGTRSAILSFITQYAKDTGALMAAVLSGLVGLGAPPAIGFLLERLVSFVLAICSHSMWNYPSVQSFRLRAQDNLSFSELDDTVDPSAFFHVLFYSCADPKLVDFTRRHRAQMYASWIGATAIIAGLVVTLGVFSGTRSLICYSAWLLVAAMLSATAVRTGQQHRAVIDAWAKACAPLACNSLLQSTGDGTLHERGRSRSEGKDDVSPL